MVNGGHWKTGLRRCGQRWLAWMVATTCALALVGGSAVPASAKTVRDFAWHLDALSIGRAHQVSDGAGVVVGVIDTGVYTAHPDLAGQVLPGMDSRAHQDTDGHGTAIAGIIAGTGERGVNGVLGIAPGSKILPVVGSGMADGGASAIRWAVDHGADVINVSLSVKGATSFLADAVRYAQSKDVVVVAGVGNINQGDTEVAEPASLPGVIAVGATGRSGEIWSNSVRGPELALTAPGVEIIEPAIPGTGNRGYSLGTGTSSATAIVSGVAALIRSKYPGMDAVNVINHLIRTADDKGPTGRDRTYGFGLVNPVAALTADVPEVSTNPLGSAAASSEGSTSQAQPAPGKFEPKTWTTPWSTVLTYGLLLAVAAWIVLHFLRARIRRRRYERSLAAAGFPPQWRPPPGWPPPPGWAPQAGSRGVRPFPSGQQSFPPGHPGYAGQGNRPSHPAPWPGHHSPPQGFPPGSPPIPPAPWASGGYPPARPAPMSPSAPVNGAPGFTGTEASSGQPTTKSSTPSPNNQPPAPPTTGSETPTPPGA